MQQAEIARDDTDLTDALQTVAVNSSYNASRALSKWFKRGVRLKADGFEYASITTLADAAGPPDQPVAAIHMDVQGDLRGDVLLVFPEAVGLLLADLLMGAAPGTSKSFTDFEQSCLQETGNIVGTSFANCLAQWLKLEVVPASPTFIHDLACAVIEPLLIREAAIADEALLAKTEFELDEQSLDWSMMLLLSSESLQLIKQRCESDNVQRNALHAVAVNGAFNASRALSKWIRKGVCLSTEGFVRLPLREAHSRFDSNECTVGLHMRLHDHLHGHALLMMPLGTARELVEMLAGMKPESEDSLDEMARSCLCETANIVGTAFSNSMAKWLDIESKPSSPEIQLDLADAIFQHALLDQAAAGDDVLMSQAVFRMDGRALECDFYLLPSPESFRLIEEFCD